MKCDPVAVPLGTRAERLFAELCNLHFLRGFVFHSPRFHDPNEKEAGDVVLWVRRQVIVVEILARDTNINSSTTQYVKRIGEKRTQLTNDYKAFCDPSIDINLVNEEGERVNFDTLDIGEIGFSGIILLDCDSHLEKPHFESIAKSLNLPFPVAVMTRRDFLDITSEIDTIPDLTYYLADRTAFLKQVYPQQAHLFLDLNTGLEKNLISFYKLHECNFSVSGWNPTDALRYHDQYKNERLDQITARDAENAKSHLIDNLIDVLRGLNKPEDSTLLHSWELATLTRRQRAGMLSTKIADAMQGVREGVTSRHFGFFNQATGCWMVFFFQYGGDFESFHGRAKMLTVRKLFVELRQSDFKYSVFGYGFRKSNIDTDSTFDDVVLTLEDADDHNSVSDEEYQDALRYFGGYDPIAICEFPPKKTD